MHVGLRLELEELGVTMFLEARLGFLYWVH